MLFETWSNSLTDMPPVRTSADTMSTDDPEEVSECRDSFIRWLTTFTISTTKKHDVDVTKYVQFESDGTLECSV